jgi:hypothetical protein
MEIDRILAQPMSATYRILANKIVEKAQALLRPQMSLQAAT